MAQLDWGLLLVFVPMFVDLRRLAGPGPVGEAMLGFGLLVGSLANLIARRPSHARKAWLSLHGCAMPAMPAMPALIGAAARGCARLVVRHLPSGRAVSRTGVARWRRRV